MASQGATVLISDSPDFGPGLLDIGRPLLVKQGAQRMRAYQLWDDAYLRRVLRNVPLVVRFPDGARAKVQSDIFWDYLARPEDYALSRGSMYLTDFYLKPDFDEPWRGMLAAAAPFPFDRGRDYAEWTSIYAGPVGTFSEFHQDIFSTHTWLGLLRGRKKWRLAPPDVVDPDRASSLVEFVQESGDLIILPPDWWHEVYNLSATLAVSGNFCSWEHAQASRATARASLSPNRDVWLHTWTEILRHRGEQS